MKFWLKCALLLAGVWLLAGAVIYWSRHVTPTAASVTAYLQRTHLAGKTGRERAQTIAKVESQLNEVSLGDRQQLQRSGVTRAFFVELTPDERLAFLDATLPAGFKQWMESFNRMDPAQRKRIVQQALVQMQQAQPGDPGPRPDERVTQRFVDQGMRSFYKDADAGTKLDLAPLIEQMQKNFQNGLQ